MCRDINELKTPCPLCGGTGFLMRIQCDRWIECDECGAKTPVYSKPFLAEHAWNTGHVCKPKEGTAID